MVGVIHGNWKDHLDHMKDEEEKTGLRPQL
jgi:hypothetical protein